MNVRFRKPEWIPTIATLCIVALTFSLSVWQIKRLHWKNDLLATIEKAQREVPKSLLSLPDITLPQHEWHNIIITGTLLNDKELYATPRYLKGEMGYAVLTPLAFTTPAGIRYALINRGWVPPHKKDPRTRPRGNPRNAVTVEGVIRTTFKQNRFVPDNNPSQNLWFWYDLPAMSRAEKLPLLPVLIDATRIRNADGSAMQDAPIPFPVEITLRNDHLGYAITWFLIGLSALAVYGFYYLEKKPRFTH